MYPCRDPTVICFQFNESQETQHEATENEDSQGVHGAVRPPRSVKSWEPRSVLAALHPSVLGGQLVNVRGSWVGTSHLGMEGGPT